MAIDHASLLLKYLAYVRDCEGDDLIDDTPHYVSEVAFTPEEWAALRALSAQLDAQRRAQRERPPEGG